MLVNATIWERIGIRNLAVVMLVAFLMLSLVPLTGWSGQISLAQITFVGIGAWALVSSRPAAVESVRARAVRQRQPVGAARRGAASRCPFGVLMALPALRLQGLYLALATMAFARMAGVRDLRPTRGVRRTRASASRRSRSSASAFNEPFSFLGIQFGARRRVPALRHRGVRRRRARGRRAAAQRVRAPPGRHARQPGRVRHARREPVLHQARGVRLSAAIAGFAGALLGCTAGSAGDRRLPDARRAAVVLLLVVGGVAVVSGAVFGGFALQSFAWLTIAVPGQPRSSSGG